MKGMILKMNNKKESSNRLINEKSPYLLQHAYNPVNWFPWGQEAFDKAKAEDKPVFLSIGYSTCHWCHVMEKESFEDEEVAEYLNDNFVAIKVDKEERPDIDSIYMSVCQRITGSGGWPLTIVMFPNQKPLFAGTYFPKKSKHYRIGLLELLETIVDKWETDKESLIESSKKITDAIKEEYEENISDKITSKEIVQRAIKQLTENFKKKYGGFGTAPKFPTPHNLMFLLRVAYHEKNQMALRMVEKTLESMYQGGIFDHLGYGFSRYSTDEKWLVPHFEKMLYDNGLLIMSYLEAYQFTSKKHFKQIAEMTMEYVLRELTDEQGGFYCAQDADSEGVEGKYYVFTPDEIIKLLGEEDGRYFNKYYDITNKGNFEGKSIPNRLHQTTEQLFQNENLENDRITILRKKVFEYRLQRTKLHKDDKILTSWNGLMIVAFSKAYRIVGKHEYLQAARKAEQFVRENLSKGNRLYVRYRDQDASENGHLDDYAFYIWALLELYEATFEVEYLERGIIFSDIMIQQFFDEKEGGFYLYAKDSEELIHRPKEIYDGAIPSGNSVAAYILLKLSAYTGNTNFTQTAEKQLGYIGARIEQYPSAYCFSLIGFMLKLYPTKELVCVAENSHDVEELKERLSKYFLPDITVLVKYPEISNRLETVAEYIKNYKIKDREITFYLCENQSCMAPFHDIDKLEALLTNPEISKA